MCLKIASKRFYSCKFLGGLETEHTYPYEAKGQSCKLKKSNIRVYINESVAIPPNEGIMAVWLASRGPISICLNANAMQVIVTCIFS